MYKCKKYHQITMDMKKVYFVTNEVMMLVVHKQKGKEFIQMILVRHNIHKNIMIMQKIKIKAVVIVIIVIVVVVIVTIIVQLAIVVWMSKGRKKKILSNIYEVLVYVYVLVSYEIHKFWDYDVEQKIILENEKVL